MEVGRPTNHRTEELFLEGPFVNQNTELRSMPLLLYPSLLLYCLFISQLLLGCSLPYTQKLQVRYIQVHTNIVSICGLLSKYFSDFFYIYNIRNISDFKYLFE